MKNDRGKAVTIPIATALTQKSLQRVIRDNLTKGTNFPKKVVLATARQMARQVQGQVGLLSLRLKKDGAVKSWKVINPGLHGKKSEIVAYSDPSKITLAEEMVNDPDLENYVSDLPDEELEKSPADILGNYLAKLQRENAPKLKQYRDKINKASDAVRKSFAKFIDLGRK